jgi:hypothetical protein
MNIDQTKRRSSHSLEAALLDVIKYENTGLICRRFVRWLERSPIVRETVEEVFDEVPDHESPDIAEVRKIVDGIAKRLLAESPAVD